MRKILKFLKGRLFLTIVNLMLQFLLIFTIVMFFNDLLIYYVILWVLSLIFCISVINKRTNSGYKIAWLMLLFIVPFFGPALYITLNGDSFRLRGRRKMKAIVDNVDKNLHIENKISIDDDKYAKLQSDYIDKYSHSYAVKNTSSKYFSSGEEYFESLLVDLQGAKKHIYLEFFIIKQSYMWDEIKKILISKVKDGVDVRVIYDDVGSIDEMTRGEIRKLRKKGVKITPFNYFVPIISTILNNRDHRKICVIDSKIAYSGGINIADEYINKYEKFGYFKDSGIALYGEGAYNFEVFFATLWNYVSKDKISLEKPSYEEKDKGIFQPYTDSPIDEENVGKHVYMNAIAQAREYVYISTPYFVVDDEMLTAITNASKMGVDVRIVLPGIPDKKTVNQVTKSFYDRLVKAGVKVYEYKKGFNHSKLLLTDDKIATVGSVNFDYRSFYLSFECGVWMYKTDTIKDIAKDFEQMFEESILIDQKKCKASIFTRLFRAILSAFAPMF